MKLLTFFAALVFLSCRNGSGSAPQPTRDTPVYFPFAPTYSNDLAKGNERYAEKVLQVWRQYESGDVMQIKESFGDSLRIILPEKLVHGTRDSILQIYKAKRATYSTMQCLVHSWMPVHVSDLDEDLVLVWGMYDGTKINGERDYAIVHEIWRFDKAGKITELEQFRTHPH